ncbi:hypothetical protein [Phycicoccus avicenniae]|uniref:hypothetical protein n=1 Tax=Phycicoccus avicenniae TaxID=2828860 RepID=UPI003D2C88C8
MDPWTELAERQAGALAWRQLHELGVTRSLVRNKLASGRWARRTESVLTTTTGPLSDEQRHWVAVLHCGPDAMLGGLTALGLHGLSRWERDEVCVIVRNADSFEPVDGISLFRTRRRPAVLRGEHDLPRCRVEPAALLWAAHEPHPRSASGLLAAVVQQGLTTPERLLTWVDILRPLRRAGAFRELLHDIEGGAQSLGEVDVARLCRTWGLVAPHRQRCRVDRSGRQRFTDCEWDLPDGRVLVLEVDGAFHLDVEQYTDDVRRQRGLTTPERSVIRCTTEELRREPWSVGADLVALGVPRVAAPAAG